MKIKLFFQNFIGLVFVSQFCYAAELLPTGVREVVTPGAEHVVIEGATFAKVSSVYEYQYPKAKIQSAQGPHDQLILDLDEQAVGFSIVIYTEGRSYGYVYQLTNPLGEELVSPSPKNVPTAFLAKPEINGRGQLVSPNGLDFEVFKNLSISAVPINDKVKVVPGRWTFSIDVEAFQKEQNDSFRVSVFVKKSKQALTKATRGQIHLETFVTPDSGVPQDLKQMQKFLENNKAFKNIGVSFVVQKHTVISSAFNKICNTPDYPCYEMLSDLQKTTQPRIAGTSKAIFVKRNNYSDAGIANFQGSVSSLFADSKDMFDGAFVWTEPNIPGYYEKSCNTFTHEFGHHLGLYHTNRDQITDTSAVDHWLEGEQKPVHSNLMTEGGGEDFLTEGQKYVVFRSPVVELYAPVEKK